MCAIAVMALGAPSLELSRRNLAPKALWLRSRAEAASRSAVEARLITCRVPRLSTLPPLLRLSGHKPSQEAKCFSVFQRRMSTPTSETMVCAFCTSMPSIRVRSTHPRDAVQLPAKVKTRWMPTRVVASAWFRNGFAHRVDSGFHASQLPVNAFSTCLNLLLVGPVKIQALFENE
jgi:hypothetical protein